MPQANPGASYAAQRAEIDAAVARVLAGGRYILGEEVAAFEAEFAAYLGVEQAVGVASGTDAIELALRACEIGPGQAVIAPSHTAVATIAAIERAGARPVLIDVDPLTYTIAAADVEAVLGQHREFGGCRPAAVIPVHLYGNPADMPAILDVAARHGLRVIEDCAQSHRSTASAAAGREPSATWRPSVFIRPRTSARSATADWSPRTTRELAARLRRSANTAGNSGPSAPFLGSNSRLDEIQAAILRRQARDGSTPTTRAASKSPTDMRPA